MALTSTPLRLAMVAGEPSGDLLGAVAAGRAECAPARFGAVLRHRRAAHDRRRLRLALADGQADRARLCRGAQGQIPDILRIRGELKRQLLAERPDAFIGVDAPDFNFGVEHALRDAGIPTMHFVCPSIWAWRGGRIKKIAKSVDHMLCLFPFEPALLEKAGVASTYVGHPLADDIPLEPDTRGARIALGLPESGPVIAVLPGSRRSEIGLIGPTFFAAMALMQQREPGVRFVMPAATPALRELLQPLVDAHPQLRADDHRRPLAGGHDGRRRDPREERHRHAGSCAAEEADGDLVQGALADRADHAPPGLSAVCRPAEHPGGALRRARAAAAFRDARGAGRRDAHAVARRSEPPHADRDLHRDAPVAAAEHGGARRRGHRARGGEQRKPRA